MSTAFHCPDCDKLVRVSDRSTKIPHHRTGSVKCEASGKEAFGENMYRGQHMENLLRGDFADRRV